MKWGKAGVVLLGVAIGMAACSTPEQNDSSSIPTGVVDPSVQSQWWKHGGCPSPDAVKWMIVNLFQWRDRGIAISTFEHEIDAYRHGDSTGAQAIAARLWAFTLDLYNAGRLAGAGTPGGEQAVVAFGDAVFCNAGLHVNLSTNLNDNVVAIVPPNTDTIVRTGTSNAGVQLFASQQLPQEVVVITRLPDTARTPTCPQYSGPLCTPLAQFPPFYDYSLNPAPQLGSSAPPFIVEECVDTTEVHVPLNQLFIAHNVSSDSAAVLPIASGTNLGLACDQSLGMAPRRSLFELARRGDLGGLASELGSRISDFVVADAYAAQTGTGITGKTKSFSPFGIVDVNDLIAYQNGDWTYHAPTLTTNPPAPMTGDIPGFQLPTFVPDPTWVVNTSAFGDSPFGSGNNGFNCPLSMLPNLNKVWPSFNPIPPSTGNLNDDPSSIFLLRGSFFLPASWNQDLQVGIAIDNDVEVFINGAAITPTSDGTPLFVIHEGCAQQDSFVYDVPLSMLNVGAQNLIAIRARDRGGESYIDARLSATTPLTPTGGSTPPPPAP
jgi:hypothetical protein